MLCLYLVRSELFTSYILTWLRNEIYFRKYEKLLSTVIHTWKNYRKKWICWKCVARKFGYVYLRFDPLRRHSRIALLPFISLTTIVTLSWLGGVKVTHLLSCARGPAFNSQLRQRDFIFHFLFCCCCVITFLSKNNFFVTNVSLFF